MIEVPVIKQLGFPTWYSEAYDMNVTTASLLVVIAAFTFGLILAYRFDMINRVVLAPLKRVPVNSDSVPLHQFSSLIQIYMWVTLAAVVSALFVGLGKIFAASGTLHNAAEFGIGMFLASSAYQKHFYLASFVYILFIWIFSILLTWPYDALFFKWQGITFDAVLLMSFVRLYLANRQKTVFDEEGHVLLAEPKEELLIVPGDVKDGQNPLPAATSTEQRSAHNTSAGNRVILLVIAALFHVTGNIIVVFDFTLHSLCYAVAFPLYGYFIFSLKQSDTLRYAKNTFATKFATVFFGLVVSSLAIVLTLLVPSMKK